ALGFSDNRHDHIGGSRSGNGFLDESLCWPGVDLQFATVGIQSRNQWRIVGDVGTQCWMDPDCIAGNIGNPLLHADSPMPIAAATPVANHVALIACERTHKSNRT